MIVRSGRVQNWTRDELEDAYLRAYDENQDLRHIIADQKVKIKTYVFMLFKKLLSLSTKILRITADNKKFTDVYAKAKEEVNQGPESQILVVNF